MKNYRETAQESGPGKVGCFGGELIYCSCIYKSKSDISSSPLVVTKTNVHKNL